LIFDFWFLIFLRVESRGFLLSLAAAVAIHHFLSREIVLYYSFNSQ
jgi:hypothetical protein